MKKSTKIIFYFLISLLALFLLLPMVKKWFFVSGFNWPYIFALSFLLTFLLTPLMKFIAVKTKVLDYPEKRKIHTNPTPLLGGVAIYISFTFVLLYTLALSPFLMGIILGGTLIMAVGLVDDIKTLPSWARLIAQIVATLIIIKFGIVFAFAPNVLWGYIVEIMLTFIWVIGITNAFNFMDGMDGLATGLGIIAALCFFIFALWTDQPVLALPSICLVGSCSAFLRYNFKPAKIFLGDAGATFIGFTLASTAIVGNWAEDNVVALAIPVVIMGIVIFDMIYTTISRILKGKVTNFVEWFDYVGKDHLHHRLVALRMSERQTVVLIYLISLCLGLMAIAIRRATITEAVFVLTSAMIFLSVVAILMKVGEKV